MTDGPEVEATRRYGAMAAGVLLALLFMVPLGYSRWAGREVAGLVTWVASEGWRGELAFLGVLVLVCLTGIIPASMLAMAAGTLYGFGKGVVLSSAGLSIGGVVGFLAAKSLFRDVAERWVGSRVSLQRIDADIARQGWRVVALLRLSPVAPFGITSYALGLTHLRTSDYLLGTIGALPAMTAYVYMGALARNAIFASSGSLIPWVRLGLTGLGVLATAAVAAHFYRLLKGSGANQ